MRPVKEEASSADHPTVKLEGDHEAGIPCLTGVGVPGALTDNHELPTDDSQAVQGKPASHSSGAKRSSKRLAAVSVRLEDQEAHVTQSRKRLKHLSDSGDCVPRHAEHSVKAEVYNKDTQPESRPAPLVKAEQGSAQSAAASVRASPPNSQGPKRRKAVKQELKAELAPQLVREAAQAAAATAAAQTGPFPEFVRPYPEECQAVRDALAAVHGEPAKRQLGEPKFKAEDGDGCDALPLQATVLDSLVRTILSQNTTDVTSHVAFANLKRAFPSWEGVRTAPAGTVEAAIRCGGLAEIKTARIKAILNTLLAERGACCLEHLRSLPDDHIKADLTRFKGVGAKTVACVLMFCLGRTEFPVDTHVWHISKALGWVPQKASRDETYQHLNLRVPDPIKYDLHVLMVEHGKRCARCAKSGHAKAPVVDCPLRQLPLMPKAAKGA